MSSFKIKRIRLTWPRCLSVKFSKRSTEILSEQGKTGVMCVTSVEWVSSLPYEQLHEYFFENYIHPISNILACPAQINIFPLAWSSISSSWLRYATFSSFFTSFGKMLAIWIRWKLIFHACALLEAWLPIGNQ